MKEWADSGGEKVVQDWENREQDSYKGNGFEKFYKGELRPLLFWHLSKYRMRSRDVEDKAQYSSIKAEGA